MAYTKEYLEQLKNLHNKKTFGTAGTIPQIVHDLILNKFLKSVLDYGAGKGNTTNAFLKNYPLLNVYSFDPVTFPNKLPDCVDLIYSSDVLEHIEPNLLDETLLDLCNRASKYQYHLIACHPAKKSLLDGRNAHLIIEDPMWWKSKIENFKDWTIIHEEIIEYTATVKKGPPIDVIKYVVLLEKTK